VITQFSISLTHQTVMPCYILFNSFQYVLVLNNTWSFVLFSLYDTRSILPRIPAIKEMKILLRKMAHVGN
jgi:hypothetical protein